MSSQFSTTLEYIPVNTVKEKLANFNIKPRKSLGQNFLVEKEALKIILKEAQLETRDTVLEVGPGLGVLTKNLAQQTKKVIAVEKDHRLIPLLKKEVESLYNNVRLYEKDILDFLKQENYSFNKVVSNPPYYIISPLLNLLLEKNLDLILLTLPKKQGERVLAAPPKANRLSIMTLLRADVEKIATFSKKAFWPQPKVDSLLLKITPRSSYNEELVKFVKNSFSQPRKTLANNLKNFLSLPKNKLEKIICNLDLNLKARPGELTLEQWRNLYQKIIKTL